MATFQHRIKALEKELTNSDRKIWGVLAENEKPFLLSMNELSKLSGVSEPSVVRFYRKLGYTSYQELKVALAQEMSADNEASSIYEQISMTDTAEEVFEKVLDQTIAAFQTTKHMINYKALHRVGEIMAEAKRLYFFGQGVSGIIASDAAHKFLRLGMNAIVMTDLHMEAIAASHMNAGDVIFAVSHSGETIGLLNVLQQAKEKGVRIIVITGFAKSSIAHVAEELLVTSSNETDYRSDAMISRIVQLAIIDSLYVISVLRKGKAGIDAVNASRLAVAKLKT
ncbi:MurR/RpiR family transcriptional regulator [Paenibacillus sp. LHD-117]|uniref:MurR/RpiR family transcriptional regulator n=1 Tax=Paenibacillus sp. LHD-117 TaxID=3071412 RepID=UPI0027E0FF1C|nr:MurR/RpiR family transcriptional regulator [Paenibacillus sp. LHD-117]MDQ6419826.1 MurR/RpiR family transcriptional regulator [Paenibacillus sp. LHD-117]